MSVRVGTRRYRREVWPVVAVATDDGVRTFPVLFDHDARVVRVREGVTREELDGAIARETARRLSLVSPFRRPL